jgi:lipid-binding SYLF domain-containing protein
MKVISIPWRRLMLLALLFATTAPAGVFGPKGNDAAEKKANVLKQRDAMLTELYASKPELKASIAKSAGYATFKNTNVNLLLLATGNGYGVVKNNKTGKETFMRMGSIGGGIGAGVKDVRVIFVFHDPKALEQFVEKGWQFGGQADASAKYKDTGVAAEQSAKANVSAKEGVTGGATTAVAAGSGSGDKQSGQAATKGAMEIYQFTESGIALQATVSGTKYWKDSELN